jgi:hypothetical protein
MTSYQTLEPGCAPVGARHSVPFLDEL